ncbi:hypothetical protein BWK58_15255 [Flavobacterium columnare]|nr:hypothetical protein BWK58_15255 [Flavobacterium columnare]
MSTKYKATTTEDCYFITITTVGWVDAPDRSDMRKQNLSAIVSAELHSVPTKSVKEKCYRIFVKLLF